MLIAAAIVLVAVMYFVDRNRQWKRFFKVLGVLAGLAIVGLLALYLQDLRNVEMVRCTSKVRRAYPTAYNDMDDQTLYKRILAKYPNCELPQSLPSDRF